MLKIEVKSGEKIEHALKRYKRKVRNTKLHNQLKTRRYYAKPSAEKREQLQKATYQQQYILESNNQ